jgi:8-amino-7-oxononanoate synthase
MLIWRLIAIIICSPLTRLYLINYARPLIYTTFMSYPSLAAIKASYTFMASGETEQVILVNRPSRFEANNLR